MLNLSPFVEPSLFVMIVNNVSADTMIGLKMRGRE